MNLLKRPPQPPIDNIIKTESPERNTPNHGKSTTYLVLTKQNWIQTNPCPPSHLEKLLDLPPPYVGYYTNDPI